MVASSSVSTYSPHRNKLMPGPFEKTALRSRNLQPEPYACYPYTAHDYDRIGEIDYWLNGVVGFPMALGSQAKSTLFTFTHIIGVVGFEQVSQSL
jgi:hypothetical protein